MCEDADSVVAVVDDDDVVGAVAAVINKGGIVAENRVQPELCPVTAAIAAAFNILSKFDWLNPVLIINKK